MNDPESLQFMELVATAREYCQTIDRISRRTDWLGSMFRILPRLHAAIVSMRDSGNSRLPPELADFDDRFDLFSQLRSHLGDRDVYWLEFDDPNEFSMDGEHRTGSLADDLTDIYFELKRGLNMLDAVGPDEVAHLWETGFRQHWGQHLVDAERHLYSLKINNQLC